MSSFLPSGLSSSECRLFYLLDCLAPKVVFLPSGLSSSESCLFTFWIVQLRLSSFLPSGLSSYECRLFYLLDCLAPNVVFLWFQSFQTNMMNMMRLEISMRRIGRKKYSSKYKKSEQK